MNPTTRSITQSRAMLAAAAQAGLVLISAWSGSWMLACLATVCAAVLAWVVWSNARQEIVAQTAEVAAARAEAGLVAQRESQWRALVEAVDVPMFAVGPDGLVLVANAAANAFFPTGPKGSIQGRQADGLFESLDAANLMRASRAGRTGTADVPLFERGVRRVVRVSAVHGGERVPSVVTLRDVTEESMAQRLTTDFVANASHELRTPLAAIKGAAETLAMLTHEDSAMRDRLCQMVAQNATRIEDLTRDLLDLSRLESPERPALLVDLDFAALARGVADHFSVVAKERGVTIRVDILPAAATGRSDPRLLGLVLRNLVDNAVKYSNPGGEVVLACSRSGSHTQWQVSDQGCGIPLEDQPRIFERFYRVDQSRAGPISGNGLGLALVKQAVDSLQGTIRVESVWTKGTTMTVELPDQPAGS